MCDGGQNTLLDVNVLIATHSLVLNSSPIKKKPVGHQLLFLLLQNCAWTFGLEIELYPFANFFPFSQLVKFLRQSHKM